MGRTAPLLAALAAAMLLAVGVIVVAPLEPARAAFPGENGRIVFTEESLDGYRIKLIQPDGSGMTTLVNRSSLGSVGEEAKPAMSPGGTRVAYAATLTGGSKNTEIYVINIRTRKVTQITDNEVFDGNPAWSSDGTRVAFERTTRTVDGGTNTDIYVRKTDGTGKATNVTQTPDEDEFAPAWSPKGGQIAFHTESPRDFLNHIDVFVTNLATGQRRNLTGDGTVRRDGNPNWSPDGDRIVFQSYSRDGSATSVYTMKASDRSDKRPLAEGYDPGDDFDTFHLNEPTYSPDGRKIAYVEFMIDFAGTPHGHYTLVKMNASDGSNKQDILSVNWSEGRYKGLSDPDWGVKPLR